MRFAKVLEISELKLNQVLLTFYDTELSFRIYCNVVVGFKTCLLDYVSVVVSSLLCANFNKTVLIDYVAVNLECNFVGPGKVHICTRVITWHRVQVIGGIRQIRAALKEGRLCYVKETLFVK